MIMKLCWYDMMIILTIAIMMLKILTIALNTEVLFLCGWMKFVLCTAVVWIMVNIWRSSMRGLKDVYEGGEFKYVVSIDWTSAPWYSQWLCGNHYTDIFNWPLVYYYVRKILKMTEAFERCWLWLTEKFYVCDELAGHFRILLISFFYFPAEAWSSRDSLTLFYHLQEVLNGYHLLDVKTEE